MGLLRYLLAIAVVIDHSGGIRYSTLITGTLPVQAFFLISGFYMSMILAEKYNSFSLFITNRLLRLLPVYWIFLFLISVTAKYVDGIVIPNDQLSFSTRLIVWASNLFIVGQDIFMFLGLDPKSGSFYFTDNFRENGTPYASSFLAMPQAWSVSLEIFFYLLAPFIFKKSLKVVITIFVLSILTRLILARNGLSLDPWVYRFLPNELAVFCCGYFAYRIYKSNFLKKLDCTLNKGFISVLFICLTLTIGPIERIYGGYSAVAYLMLLTLCLPFLFSFSKNSTFDRLVGELSYPIYLCHLFVLFLLQRYAYYEGNVAVLNVLISTLISYIVIKTVSDSIEKYRQSRVRLKIQG
ncbi:MAG: acyltransferase [Bdellovibrionota bacterium]